MQTSYTQNNKLFGFISLEQHIQSSNPPVRMYVILSLSLILTVYWCAGVLTIAIVRYEEILHTYQYQTSNMIEVDKLRHLQIGEFVSNFEWEIAEISVDVSVRICPYF